MRKVIATVSVSLDNYVAGPNPSVDLPLGEGGEGLHEWLFAAGSWREAHGQSGGESNADSDVIAERRERVGASIMGRNMFSGGFTDGWDDDPRATGWWGEESPFGHPVFVLTHHAREPLAVIGGTYTFVTDGIESALAQAQAAAGDKDVQINGGGATIGQYLAAGLVDELHLQVVPVLLGDGVRLFEGLDPASYAIDRVVASPTVTHMHYSTSQPK